MSRKACTVLPCARRNTTAAPSSSNAKPWGRVDADGSVFVRTPDGPDGPDSEVKVGEWLAAKVAL